MLTYIYQDEQRSSCLILTRNGSFGNFNREIQNSKTEKLNKRCMVVMSDFVFICV